MQPATSPCQKLFHFACNIYFVHAISMFMYQRIIIQKKMKRSKNHHPFLFKNSINFKLGWQTKEFLVDLGFQSYQGIRCQRSVVQNPQNPHGKTDRMISQKGHDIQGTPNISSIHRMTYERWFQMLLQLQLLQFTIVISAFL